MSRLCSSMADGFAHRPGHQQTEKEMHQPVIGIAYRVTDVAQPETKRRFRIGVVRAIDVEGKEDRNLHTGQRAEPRLSVEPPEQQSADDDQQVLKQPVAAGPGAIAIAVQKLISIAASTA